MMHMEVLYRGGQKVTKIKGEKQSNGNINTNKYIFFESEPKEFTK